MREAPSAFCFDHEVWQNRPRFQTGWDLVKLSEQQTGRRLNAEERRAVKAAEVQRFVTKYGRKAQKGAEPNDRKYDRKTEQTIRQMDPFELDRLMREDE